MTKTDLMASSAQTQAATGWVARLGGEPGEADWLEFEVWLNAAPGHRAAYDRALTFSLSVDHQAEALSDLLEGRDAPAARRIQPSRGHGLWFGSGLMAVAAVAVTFAVMHPPADGGRAETYATAKGERRDVVLSDGTKVALNTNSSISVTMKRGERRITLASGEAAFTVVHDENRPFVVHAGDRVLRDLGTDFDVLRQNGQLTVTVREGLVAVQRANNQRSLQLSAGMRMEHREGSPDTMVLVADTDQAFAWRAGRLIYRDRPLSEIVADLNRYGEDQVKVSGPAAGLHFTGVLTIDNQAAMVDRLTTLLPVTSSRRDGVIVLRELNNAH